MVGKKCSRYRFQEMVLGTVQCTGSEMAKHVGARSSEENVLHSKRDGDKVLVDPGQTLHIG